MAKTDLHIVLKNISDLLRPGANENYCAKGSIHISEENVQKIISKLEAIECLLRQLAEQSQTAATILEAELDANKSLQTSLNDSDSFESLEDVPVEPPAFEPSLDETTTAELSLPVTSIEELEHLNYLLGSGDGNLRERFTSYLKTTQPLGLTGAMQGVVEDAVLNDTHWTGQMGKYEFRRVDCLLQCIHETLLPDFDQRAFETAIKFEIGRAHSRVFRARFEKHKQMKADRFSVT